MQAKATGLERVHVGPRSQLMGFRADGGHIEKDLPRHQSLEAERPSLSVWIPKILLERSILRIRQALWPVGRKLGRPVGITTPHVARRAIDKDSIWGRASEVQRESLRVERLVTDLIAAPPNQLVITEKLL